MSAPVDLRPLPNEEAAEQLVLGAVLNWPGEALATARRIVKPEDFSLPRHRLIYQAVTDLAERNIPIELTAVELELKNRGQLEQVGGQEYIDKIIEETFSSAGLAHYAGMVHDRAVARNTIALCQRTAEQARDPQADIFAVLAEHQQAAYALAVKGGDSGQTSLGDAVEAALNHARAVAADEQTPGLMTGFESIDGPLGGFQPGDLIVLAAATSAGKTALALNVAANVAADGGTVLYVSREMQARDLGKRFLQTEARVHGQKIRFAKNLKPDDWAAMVLAVGKLGKLRVELNTSAATVADMALAARGLSARWGGPLSLIVVDYLQNCDLWSGVEHRRLGFAQAVGAFAWGLKDLALKLGTPILLLSQLNREGVKDAKPPGLHDLKESGDIENHANAVLLLHLPAKSEAGHDGSLSMLARVAKARDGMVTPWDGPGQIRLRWNPTITKFESE